MRNYFFKKRKYGVENQVHVDVYRSGRLVELVVGLEDADRVGLAEMDAERGGMAWDGVNERTFLVDIVKCDLCLSLICRTQVRPSRGVAARNLPLS